MKQMQLSEFHAALKAQGVQQREDIALVCPICGKIQSARDLIHARAGKYFDEVEKYLGFSCVGRWNAAGPFKKEKGNSRGCDWTLGGLFQLHQLEVITPDGERHPRFMPATPYEAQIHSDEWMLDGRPAPGPR